MLNWDQTKKVTILPLLLTGKAARLVEAMKDEEKDSTDRIFEILISGCSQSAESMHQEFLDRAPLPEETVVDFARALQRLLEKAVPTLGSNKKKVFLKNKLAAHLPENMRLLIKFQADKTWDQLLQCLEETLPNVKGSAIGHRSDGTMATQFKFESGEPEVKTEPIEVDANVVQYKHRFQGACFFCKKPGHKKSNCFKWKKSMEKQSGHNGSESKDGSSSKKGQFGNRRKINGSSSDELEFDSVELDVKNNEVQVDVNLSACVPSLISKKCKIRFNNDFEKQRFKTLFDGGATNSLIRFDSLSSKMQNEIKYFLNKQVDMNKRGFKKFPVTIKGVTSLVSEDCSSPGANFNWFMYNAVHQSPCVTVNHVVLEPRSESYRGVNSLSEKDVMFTPKSNGEGVYWSHCVSKMDENGDIYVKVLNLNTKPVNVEANDYVGFSTENFELVEEKTEIEVDSATLGTYSSMADVEEKLTKIKKAKAVKDFTAYSTAKFVFEEIICKFGMVFGIMSDQGVNFKSALFQQLCRLCSLKKINLTFYHPAGNGQIERMVRTIKQILTMYVNCTHSNWDEFLQASVAAYNTRDVVLNNPVVINKTPKLKHYVSNLKDNLKTINGIVRNNLEQAQARQKNHYDKFVRNGVKFKEGDLVLLTNSRVKPGESQAFITRAIGPFRILSLFNDVNYKVLELSTGKCKNVHCNRLVNYNQRVNIQSTGIHRVYSSDNSINFSSSIAVNNVKANKLEHEDLIEFDTASILYFNYLYQQNFEWSALEGYDFALEDLNDQIFSCRICS
ncbi:Retrovirus-related Pol poly from transposon [Brachionus plicatilis]|uniref:Retrovirus-related Pol poly from transposon n=1 Tax=Brachionus plicatilis TaxID=10195 RepID=A0A3M7SS76_BRAPC|nr:Retrovirus-related Pol poly from transposon [Brachionus plicatilis]